MTSTFIFSLILSEGFGNTQLVFTKSHFFRKKKYLFTHLGSIYVFMCHDIQGDLCELTYNLYYKKYPHLSLFYHYHNRKKIKTN